MSTPPPPGYGYVPPQMPSWPRRHMLGIILMAAGALLVGGIVAVVASKGSSGPSSYLATDDSGVTFIQWQPDSSGSGISGTITADAVEWNPPTYNVESLAVSSYPFTGSINGNSVTVSIFGHTFYGILNGGTLTISVLNSSSGSIQATTYTQASTSAYNAAVAALRARIHGANVLAAAALARRQQQAAKAAAAARKRAVAAANKQAAANTTADQVAHAACHQFGGQWSASGIVNYTAYNYTLSISGGSQNASCDNVPYLGSDDATYYLSVRFSPRGAAQPVHGWTGSATQAECNRGYYPDDSVGPTYAKPGSWSGILGICVTNG